MPKMKCPVLFLFVGLAGLAQAVAPAVKSGSVTMSQPSGAGKVFVDYELENVPAVVTLDVETNGPAGWASIGLENLQELSGDVNRVVGTGPRRIVWKSHKSWPGHVIAADGARAVVTAWATNAPPDYMVVDLGVENSVSFYVATNALPYGGLTNDTYRTRHLVMRKIPAQNVRWRMGSLSSENGREPARETPHCVTLTEDYYLAIYPMTEDQAAAASGTRKTTNEQGGMCPVNGWSWSALRRGSSDGYDWPANGHDVAGNSFLGILRGKVNNRVAFDLPTDAQWEFACRAGSTSAFCDGAESDGDGLYGWYNCGVKKPVGGKLPNAWGLYDMHGNIFEFCLDWFCENANAPFPADLEVTDPTGPTKDENASVASHRGWRCLRGGSWGSSVSQARSARRHGVVESTGDNYRGFRIAAPARVGAE